MAMYELWWIRYFRSERKLSNFYSDFFFVPLAGATLPVLAFFLLGVYGKVGCMLFATTILGIGHIGIHMQHRRMLQNTGQSGEDCESRKLIQETEKFDSFRNPGHANRRSRE